MSDIALSRIAHLIKVEDDLIKIPQLRQQFVKEKSSVDIKLGNTTQLQIELIMKNLSKLNNAANKLNAIKGSINRVNQLYDDSITDVKDYATIKKMTTVNQFLTQVQNLYLDISKFKGFLDNLDKMIEAELHEMLGSLTYPLSNIFLIHYQLTQARNFQDYLERDSQNLSDDLKSIVYKIVAPIKRSVKHFDELLGEAITSITEAAKDGNVALIFKVIKIIEFESNEDLKVSLMDTLGFNETRDMRTVDYATFRGSRRHYKKFFYNKLEESLEETFNSCVEHFVQDKVLVYDNLEWLEDELLFVTETLNPLFPSEWEVSSFIQNVYYNKLHKFTMEFIKTDPPAEDLMKILSYDSHYSKFIAAISINALNETTKRISTIKKEQKSIIGEDLKNTVLEDYLKVIVLKMEEWNNNLVQQETLVLKKRDSPPDIYGYHQVIEDYDAQDQIIMLDVDTDVFVLPDFKTPMSMLKEQADVAADSGYSKILVGVIENWSTNYNKRVLNYQRLIEEEFDKYMSVYNNERYLIQESKARRLFRRRAPEEQIDVDNMTPEQLAEISQPGLIEYLTALGNTYEINTDRLQDKFLPNYKDKVHASYHTRIERAFEETINPSTELISQVIRCIVDIVVNDLYPALSTIFTKSWYDDKTQTSDEPTLAQKIVETIGEYMEELRGYASYEVYLVTFTVFLDSFISAYIRIGYENILHGNGKKIDPTAIKKHKSFSEAVSRDATIFYGGLESLFTRKDAEYLFNSLRAIEFLGDLATCENPQQYIPQMWENEILGSFYHCSVDYVKGICLCRKDMDTSQVNALVKVLTDIKKDYHLKVEPPALPTGTLNDFYYN